ncbi:MAG TPA: 3-deoxy-7-phosphoheptulonate synthase [Chlamydiales bacterium]|jgi:3-deoxy-7-phosphoheptulonate synthase|nr:3-deoxy-7-phosphoheptulonate synthase [Chlamydiales bacterium]
MSFAFQSVLLSPDELENEFPAPSIIHFRAAATKILRKELPRIAILLGPCSIHNPEEAIDFGRKLVELQQCLSHFFLIMRVFFEKPRTRLGWKGLMYDPFLDGSNNLQEGLRTARKLLLDLNALGVPCATEFLDPLIAPYLSNLITWGLIGARTGASQPHRQLASGFNFPVGFKNGVYGELEPALSGIVSARMPHAHFSIDRSGRLAAVQTTGTTLAHLVLRGSETEPNCSVQSVQAALQALREHHLEERLVIDCSHGNSGKDPQRQKWAFETAIEQIESGNRAIRALMLESNLVSGKQPLSDEPERLCYGVSITDPCLGWEETAELLCLAEERLSLTSMSSVQK